MKDNLHIAGILLEFDNREIIGDIVNYSYRHWFTPNTEINFSLLAKVLKGLNEWDLDVYWNYVVYEQAEFFFELLESEILNLEGSEEVFVEREELVALLATFVTSTTVRELRDLATKYLILFGRRFPEHLLELTKYSSSLKDIYIYERLTTACYGVMLIEQNNSTFLSKYLSSYAESLYQLQFGRNPEAPVYNYLVIDSIKHLVDLAMYKGCFSITPEAESELRSYKFHISEPWNPPSADQMQLINSSSQMSWPDPIGMDFGIYTIPRLMIEHHIRDREAIAQVYKRIFELGYKNLKSSQLEESFKSFYWGTSLDQLEGKVDRLGKKYSWKAFFDYAGYLLGSNELAVFEERNTEYEYYERLSDVDIDVSLPHKSRLNLRIYESDLIANLNDPTWYEKQMIDTLSERFEISIGPEDFILLHAHITEKPKKDYSTRSLLIAETFFIRNNENIKRLKKVCEKVFDWEWDLHFSPDGIRRVYFGELYWADNMPKGPQQHISIRTGDIIQEKRKVTFEDVRFRDKYKFEDIGKEIAFSYEEVLTFESEPTLSEYLWESDSKLMPGFSEYLPSVKIGKLLGLKANCKTGKILDSNLNESFHTIAYDSGTFSNDMSYMRKDLLKRYMKENNLSLLYQVKQHSYNEMMLHNRIMKYFTISF